MFLLLLLLDVPLNAIQYDYCLSGPELSKGMEETLVEMRELGFTDDYIMPPINFVPVMYDHVMIKYGEVKNYLSSIGIHEAEQDRILDQLQG